MRFFLDQDTDLGDAFSLEESGQSPAVYYAACTLKYKGTQISARFAPPFVHQVNIEAYMRKYHDSDSGAPTCLPVCLTHPALADAEKAIAAANMRANRQDCFLYQLPDETLLNVFKFLEPEELARSMRTSRIFRCLATENKLWSYHLNSQFGKNTSALSVDSKAHRAASKTAATSPSPAAALVDDYVPTDSSLFARYRVMHNWSNGLVDSKRNFWCNTEVKSVHFDDRFIACGTDDEICLFDADTGARLISKEMLEEVLQLDFDQTKLVASGSQGSVYIFDLEHMQLTTRFDAHRKDIEAMHLVRDSSHLLTGSWNKDVKYWDLQSESMVLRIDNAHAGAISGLRWLDPSSPTVFASISYEPTVKFWDTRVGATPVHSIAKLHIGAISAIAISADQTQMVTGGEDASIKLAELRKLSDANAVGVSEDGFWLQNYRGHTQTIRGLFFEKSGRLLSGSADCSVRIWNQKTGKVASVIPTGKVTSLHCDDDVLLVGLEAKRATMFDFRLFKSENTEARRKFYVSRCQPEISAK
eukprot:TRINITY_DN3907_c0_g1_i2.p1 TRINITY_DN3907_c0_g1~~TRINITY_DN3907_c0_g1_i2.p1  ORF type:complete len:530 (+),score=111.16 TRINITY_DN3907_c0_g1_i2:491-2080(+)